ncbi:hypothetical protein NBRC111894_1546 [Sporolactobacillus inulinus]|uniref:Uncharacterized protein n=1 Tax=Sporolactobacillus inulinus TaxID=2078 RepID=A0A4Y1ZAA3_9BACL|nr:hypothetical protein NBRC111894_1546 [Sporolactobacillus inulinus]
MASGMDLVGDTVDELVATPANKTWFFKMRAIILMGFLLRFRK